jgi:hypothetical protein
MKVSVGANKFDIRIASGSGSCMHCGKKAIYLTEFNGEKLWMCIKCTGMAHAVLYHWLSSRKENNGNGNGDD